MKIVLPLAGKGTRLLPHTQHIPKPLMFLAGASILDHLLRQLIPLNPTEFVFITGYLQEQIQDHMHKHYPDLPIRFIEQKEQQGLGHAIYQARDAFAKDEDMLVILGDQTFTIDWAKMLKNTNNRLSVVPVDDPSSFGIVLTNDSGIVTEMEEKPDHPKSNLAISGTYYFPSAQSVFSTIAYQIAKDIRTKGEIQITDTMRIMMESGEVFETLEIADWNDCGNHDDFVKANATLLNKERVTYSQYGDDVTIIEPVYIDKSVKISNSTIGPNVSLAEGVVIDNSVLTDVVVDKNTQITSSELTDSYLGQNMIVTNIKDSCYHKA